MFPGGVTFVAIEPILGETAVPALHHAIAGDFGDHAGGSDAQGLGIAVDDGRLGERQSGYGPPIHQEVLRLPSQDAQRTPHGTMGRLQNVDLIDFFRRGQSYRRDHGAVCAKGKVNIFPCRRAELLGVGEPAQAKTLRQNHGGSNDGSGEGSSTHFIQAGHHGDASGTQLVFMPEAARGGHVAFSFTVIACLPFRSRR